MAVTWLNVWVVLMFIRLALSISLLTFSYIRLFNEN
jgi:hypothetical protein